MNFSLKTAVAVLSMFAVFTACESTGRIMNKGNDVTLTIERHGDGTLISEPAGIDCGASCSGLFVKNSNVLLAPGAGSLERLIGYGGSCSGKDECIVNMDTDHQVIVTFYSELKTVVTGAGRIVSHPGTVDCTSTCTTLVDPTVAITLTAEALPGNEFVEWTGGCTGAGPCVLTPDTGVEVHATFQRSAIITHQLTVSVVGGANGSVTSTPTGISCGATCTHAFVEGTIITLTAAPVSGAMFAGWSGACGGPQLTCVLPADNDHTVTARFTTTPARCGYSKRFGGIGTDFANALVLGKNGNYALAGSVYGNVDFGGGAIVGPSNRAMAFAATFNADGMYTGAFGKGANGAVTLGQSAGFSNDGKLIVSGLFSGSVNLGLGTTDDGIDAGQALWRTYVGKYDSAGNADWINLLGAGYQRNSGSGAMTVDDLGNTTLVGEFALPETFGTANTRVPNGGTDVYIAQFSTAGSMNWLKTAGGEQDDNALCIASNAAGELLAGGNFSGPADFSAGTPFTSAQVADGFVARYGRNGLGLSSLSIGSDAGFSDSVHGIAYGPSGESAVAGVYEGSMSLAGQTLTSAGSDDAFLVKYDNVGVPLWSRSMGGAMYDSADAVAVDSAGNIYVAGTFAGTLSIGANNISSHGDIDIFVAKFASNGDLVFVHGYGGTDLDTVAGLAIDGNDQLHIAGTFQGSINFGYGALTSASSGFTDVFFACLN